MMLSMSTLNRTSGPALALSVDHGRGVMVQQLGRSAWPGITTANPAYVTRSADIRGGMGFGLHGLGDAGDVSDWSVASIIDAIQKGLVVVNSQQLYQLNLDRLQKGLAPIPPQYAAPTVNLGVAGVSTGMLLLGAGLLVFLLLKR